MTIKKDGIKISTHRGTWGIISEALAGGHPIYLLEHEQLGDETCCIIVDEYMCILVDEVYNGFEDYEEKFNEAAVIIW